MATTCQGKKLTSCSAGPPQGSGVQREPPHTPVLTSTSVPQLQPEAATAPGQSLAQPADIAIESPVTHYVIPEDFYRVEDESDLNLDLVTSALTSHTHTQKSYRGNNHRLAARSDLGIFWASNLKPASPMDCL